MKKIISAFLSAILVLSCMTHTFALDTQPAVSIQNASAIPGGRVTVQVVISNNPGLVAMLLRVAYDPSILSLESAADGSVFDEGNAYFGNDMTSDPYVLMWEDGLATENHTADGTLATLTFVVAEDAQMGETEISLMADTDSTFNLNLEQVSLNTQSGTVAIVEPNLSDNDNAVISVDSTTAIAGTQIEVPIRIQNNPGLVAMRLLVSYDTSILTLTEAVDGNLFGAGNAYFGNDYTETPYVLMWEDALSPNDHTSDGILATLTFAVSDNAAEGQTEISLSLDEESTFNVSLNAVYIEIQNIPITVEDAEEPQGIPTISIEGVAGRVGDTIQVPITIQDNPGLIAMQISISYDPDILILRNAEDGALFGEGNAYFGHDYSTVPYTLLWEDALASQDHSGNGVLAVLEFEVMRPAPDGETEICLEYASDSTFNTNLQNVPCRVVSGTILVRFPGDANEDCEVTLLDVVAISRWLADGWNVTINEVNADVNVDCVVDLKDVILIRRFLAGGWNVVLR